MKKKMVSCLVFPLILLLLSVLFAGAVVLSGEHSEEKKVDEPAFSGRWFEKEIDGQHLFVTLNDGAMFYFEVKDTEQVTLQFRVITQLEMPYFAYRIDGGEFARAPITEGTIQLPDQERHLVQVVIDGMSEREDKWNGEIGVAFAGIDSHGGSIEGTLPKQKRILFIGDSITEGVKALGDNAVSEYNSATHSFPWYTAEMLNAEPYFIGFGATGITMTGSFNTTAKMLDHFSVTRPIADNQLPDCDLIVLNTGTNDHEASKEVFVAGYQEVVLKLHDRYPDRSILCMIPFTQLHAEDIREAVQGYNWCHVIETVDWEFSYTDGVHPDAAGARVIAGNLVLYVTEQLKWE